MSSSRRFGLLDGMVLIAAIAVAIALGIWSSATDLRLRRDATDGRLDWAMAILADISYHGCEILVCLSLALLGLAARHLRQPFRRLMGQSGVAALMVAVSVTLTSIVMYAPSL